MFAGIPVERLTAPGLLGVAILMILTGVLVPLRTYKDKKEESERWHAAFEVEREARATADAQTAELLELAKTSHMLIKAVFENSKIVRQDSEDRNVAS